MPRAEPEPLTLRSRSPRFNHHTASKKNRVPINLGLFDGNDYMHTHVCIEEHSLSICVGD